MRVSSTILLILLTIALAILLPIGTVVQTLGSYDPHHGGQSYVTRTFDLSISRLDFLNILYPGISSVFILWILVALIQVLNLLMFSRGMLSPIISWLVFLPALIAQIYLPSLVLDLAFDITSPSVYLVSQGTQPNVISSLPIALGLVIVSLRNRQKGSGKQRMRIGYG